LQNLAARLRLIFARDSLLPQQLSDKAESVYFLLQTRQFSFFAAKYFHGILHGLGLATTLGGN
jgi:hypothetical protein